MSLPYNPKIISNAVSLRKQATPQEKKLWWSFLHSYPVRFQRQKTIDNYIVDFYCHQAKLAVELDGSQHLEDSARKYDMRRSMELEKYGVKVIRFWNNDVDCNFEGVCLTIDKEVKERI